MVIVTRAEHLIQVMTRLDPWLLIWKKPLYYQHSQEREGCAETRLSVWPLQQLTYLWKRPVGVISNYYWIRFWIGNRLTATYRKWLWQRQGRASLIFISVGFPHSSVGKESTCNAGDPSSIPAVGRRDRLPTPVFLGRGSAGKESACNMGDLGLNPGVGRSPGGGKGYPLQYSGLENSMDREAWWATIHGIAKSWAWLSDFHFHHRRRHDEYLSSC